MKTKEQVLKHMAIMWDMAMAGDEESETCTNCGYAKYVDLYLIWRDALCWVLYTGDSEPGREHCNYC